MGGVGDFSDAGSNYISLVLKTNGDNQYKKIGNHNIQDSRFVFSDTYFYTMKGKFSKVPSATRTFTSIIIKIESGVRFSWFAKMPSSSK